VEQEARARAHFGLLSSYQSHFVPDNAARFLQMPTPQALQSLSLVGKESIVDPCRYEQSTVVFDGTRRDLVHIAFPQNLHAVQPKLEPIIDSIVIIVRVPVVQWNCGGRGSGGGRHGQGRWNGGT
jgi:hypothetical protein